MKLRRITTRFPIYRLIQTSALLSWLFLFPSSVVIAQEQSSALKRVLILYDENKEFPSLALLDRTLTSAFRAGANRQLEIHSEFMDISRFPDKRYDEQLREFFRQKYAGKRIDLIVAVMGPSLDFALKYGEDLFPGTPIVFCGIDSRELKGRSLGPNVTGVLVKREFKPTLDLALQLQPDTRQIVFVGGAAEFNRYWEQEARQELRELEGRAPIKYLTGLPMDELQKELPRLPPRTLILYLHIFKDGAGNTFNPTESLSLVAQKANAPIYIFFDQYLGYGAVGGHVYSFERHGAKAAQLGLRVLAGEKPADIPILNEGTSVTMVDWRQLRRWGISEDRLPPGSVIQFRELSFWDHYKWRIIGVVSLCVVEGLLIFALLTQRARRRRVEEALRDNEERLKLALSAANMDAWDWRIDTGELKLSDEMRQIFGFAGGKTVTTELFLDLIHPDDRPAVSQAITRTVNQGAPYDVEFRTIHQDGSRHWVMGKGKAFSDKAGQAARMLGVNMDITDRKQAEERLRSYFELPLIGMAITSPDRLFVEVNQKLCDILGYSMDQLTGMSWVDVTHPDDVAENIRLLDETLKGKTEGYVMDKRFIHHDGHMVYTSISERCARRADRTVDYLALIVQDITQRKQAEDRMMESEAQLRLLTELIPQHIWTGNPDNTTDFHNRRWLDYTGMTMEEVRQKGWVTALHPDDHEIVFNTIREASSRQEIFGVEMRLKGVDGQYRWFLARAMPQYDQEGNIIKWYGTNTDIEDRKRTEEALRESEARFRNMADNAPVMVWVTEADGACSFASQSWYDFTGQTPGTALGFGWVGAIHPDDCELSEKNFLAAYEKREAFRTECRLRRNDGEYRWAIGSARPRFGSQGEFLGYIGSVVDITETKRAELNTQFINQLDFELSQIADADEIIRLATSRLGEYLGVTSCYVIEVDPAAGLAFVRDSWAGWRNAGPSIVGEYRISDFVTPECLVEFEAGRATIVKDVMNDPRIRGFAAKYRSIGVGAFISIPALNERQWEANLTVDNSQARDWRPDETQLMRDITARLWPAYKRARAVGELRESEDRYRSVVEGQTELICRYLPDTTLTFVNATYCRYFGKTQEELIGTKFLDLIPETAREVVRKHTESLVENPRVEIDEHEVLLPNGNMGWQQWIDHAILDAAGKVIEFQAVGRDITERKQMEEELRESEERLRLALEAGRMGVWEWDARTNAVKWSKEHYTVMGLRPFSVEPDYDAWADHVHPDDLTAAEEAMSRAIAEKGEYRQEYRIIWPDGSVRWVEGRAKAVYDECGQCLKMSGFIVDITERKQAEDALRLSEDKFSKAFRSSPDAIAIASLTDGMIMEVNGRWEEILGYTRDEAVGRTVWELQIYQNPGERARLVSMVDEQGSARDFEVDLRKKTGEIRNVLTCAEPMMIRDEPCMLVIVRDVTELKLAEEAFRRNEEALRRSHARIEDLAGRLIAAQEDERRHIARELHDDLNQQVAALAIGISRLKRQFPDAGAAVQEQIATLREKTDWLSERIRQLSHDLHSSILQHVGLPAALNSYCAEFSDREGIAVTLDIRDGVEAVSQDAALCLYRVAQESLRNVARHSGAHSAIVALTSVNGAVELRVVDEGVGFDPGQAREGRGLGLVSMEERVKLLHGNFVLTTRPGAGTELRAQIPLRREV